VVGVREEVSYGVLAERLAAHSTPKSEAETELAEGWERMSPHRRLLEELSDQRSLDRINLLTPERTVELAEPPLLLDVAAGPGDVPAARDVQVAERHFPRVLASQQLRLDIAPNELARVVGALLGHREVDLHDELVV